MPRRLTVRERLDAIEASDLQLAYDGCHKIYLLESDEDREEAYRNGYGDKDIFPASEIRALIRRSCFLVFVSTFSLRPNAPWEIEQGSSVIFGAASVRHEKKGA